MNSVGSRSSPIFKNVMMKRKQSPKELKDKLRKDYKDKVKNCRDMLLNRFRGSVAESELQQKLNDIYKDMFNYSAKDFLDEEEIDVLEEIKKELIQEEFEWWMEEYEKSQINLDWATIEQETNVICVICQKHNFTLENNILSCSKCNIAIPTSKTLIDIQNIIKNIIERHSDGCNHEVQFNVVQEDKELHIFSICEHCGDIQSII